MIFRDDHNDNFTVISNDLARDNDLSLEARGLLVLMLSMSDDWIFSVKGLMNQTGLKRSVVIRLIKELKDSGYISHKVEKGKGGIFTATTWEIYENRTAVRFDRSRKSPQSVKTNRGAKSPQSVLTARGENRSPVKPQYGETAVGENEPIRNTNIERNTKLIRNTKEKERSPLDDLEPELRETFENFIEMRKKIKAPLTDKALKLNIEKARKLAKGDPEKMRAIVEQSIERSWRGLFPLDEDKKAQEALKPQTIPQNSNPFTELKRREGII